MHECRQQKEESISKESAENCMFSLFKKVSLREKQQHHLIIQKPSNTSGIVFFFSTENYTVRCNKHVFCLTEKVKVKIKVRLRGLQS